MENCTNCSVNYPNSDLPGPGFGAFLILILLLPITAIVLNVTIITALCVAHSVSKLIRIFLINLLVGGVIVSLIGIGFILSGLILNFTTLPPPESEFCGYFEQVYTVGAPQFPDNFTSPLSPFSDSFTSPQDCGFCRFLLWGYLVGSIARLYSLAGFSIVVLLIIRYNKKEMKALYIVIFLAAIWCVSLLLNVHYLVPSLYAVQYYDGVACFASYSSSDEAYIAFHVVFIIFGGLIPLSITIVVPIVVLCYVRRNTMSEGSSYNKGIAKFSLFLVAGNLINFVGQTMVDLIVFGYNQATLAAVCLTYLFTLISLIPTPIMILIFVKPVRAQVAKVIRYTRIPSISGILKTSTTVE